VRTLPQERALELGDDQRAQPAQLATTQLVALGTSALEGLCDQLAQVGLQRQIRRAYAV